MTTIAGEPVRILITGSRHLDVPGADMVRAVLTGVMLEIDKWAARPEVVIVHGGAAGVDTAAAMWALSMVSLGVMGESNCADWSRGRGAGPARNAAMVALGAHLCLAFPRRDSVGTWDCVRKAATAGIPVRVWPLPKMTDGGGT